MPEERRLRRVAVDRRVNLALRFCITAWLAISRWVLMLALLVCLAGAVVTKDINWVIASGAVAVVLVLVLICFMIEAPNVRCLMCGAAMLRPLRCEKHETARKWLGSYILRTTLVLATFPKSMLCPYCGGHYKLSRRSKEGERRVKRDRMKTKTKR